MVKSMELTVKQKAFAEYYLQTGCAAEAARKAGYSEKTAPFIGAENLKKPQIAEYINERLQAVEKSRIADTNEVIEFYTSVMRGEIKDRSGKAAFLSDRLKAADSLMKRYAVGADKNKGAIEKLDNLLKEFRDAVESEAD